MPVCKQAFQLYPKTGTKKKDVEATYVDLLLPHYNESNTLTFIVIG